MREWQLCTLLHCRPSQLADESAIVLDHILVLQNAANEVEAKKIKDSQDG